MLECFWVLCNLWYSKDPKSKSGLQKFTRGMLESLCFSNTLDLSISFNTLNKLGGFQVEIHSGVSLSNCPTNKPKNDKTIAIRRREIQWWRPTSAVSCEFWAFFFVWGDVISKDWVLKVVWDCFVSLLASWISRKSQEKSWKILVVTVAGVISKVQWYTYWNVCHVKS